MQCLRLAGRRCLGCARPVAAVGLLLSVVATDARPPAAGPSLEAHVTDALGLPAANVVGIEMDRTPNVPVSVVVPIDGTDYTLDLAPHSVRAEDFVFIVQRPDGSYVEREPGPVRTLRGTVRELPGSVVAGSMFEEGLSARIDMPDGAVFWIEPLASKRPDADRNLYVVYSGCDSQSRDGVCGNDADAFPDARGLKSVGFDHPPSKPDTRASAGGPWIAQLACDADYEYYLRWGSEDATRARIEFLINTVNIQYERDVDIVHVITAIIVRTEEPDPYDCPGRILEQFRDEWLENHPDIKRDLALLFTGCGDIIGIPGGIGVICTDWAYAVAQSEFNGNSACATDLIAHMLGHLWNGVHHSFPGWTMYPSIQCANRFRSVTIERIIAHRDSLDCLDELEPIELPFFEDWPTDEFDIFKWDEFTGVILGGADNLPSEPFAAQLDRTETLESREIDASGVNPEATLRFSFWLKERFTESGDTFFAEYLSTSGVWQTVLADPGSGSQDQFDFYQFELPDDAKHDEFRIRFRTEAGFNDIWFLDDIGVGTTSVPPICIIHGSPDWDRNDPNTWTSFEDWAFSAYVDPKIESTDGINRDLGLTKFDVVFNTEPFGDDFGGPVTAANVSVSVTGGAAPGIANVIKNGNVLTVELNGLMPLQEWTTFDFQVWNSDGIEIADNGNEGEGVDECSRLDVGTLPGDVNNNGDTQPQDLSRIQASWSAGIEMLPDAHIRAGSIADYFDISRDDLFQPVDISRVIAALSGSAPFTRNWNGVSLNSAQP